MAKMGYFIRRFDGKRASTYLGEDSTWGPLNRAYEWETYDGACIQVEGWKALSDTKGYGWDFDVQMFDSRKGVQGCLFA